MERKMVMELQDSSKSPWLLFCCYVRGLLLIPLLVVQTAILSVLIVIAAILLRSRKVNDFIIVSLWARPFLRVCNIKLDVRGLEHLPQEGAIYLFNHASLIDIPAVLAAIPRSLRFGAKIELFSVPLFGAALRAVGVLPIDRSRRSRVMKVYSEAEVRLSRGENFVLAPEGTRQFQPEIGKFKTGPFIFATNAKVKVVPVVLMGAYEALPKNELIVNRAAWGRTIRVDILSPLAAADYGPDEWPKLQTAVHSAMIAAMNSNQM